MEFMGMTDSQFNGFLRFVIDDLKEIKENSDNKEVVEQKVDRIIENLQQTIEK